MGFSRAMVNQFKQLVLRVFKFNNKSQLYISDIAQGLASALCCPQEHVASDPILTITNYLLAQIRALKDHHALPQDGSNLIHSFFRNLNISVHPYTQVEFQEIAKRVLVCEGTFTVVPNLWQEKAGSYLCYCGLDDAGSAVLCQGDELCYKCGRKCHSRCFWGREQQEQLFECPVCYMRNCLPLQPVDEVFFLGYLEHEPRESVEYKLKFFVDMQRLDMEHIYVRCVRLNAASRFQITFPAHCKLYFSEKELKVFEPLPATSPLKRRHDDPLHINKYLLSYMSTIILSQRHGERHSERHGKTSKPQEHHLIMIASSRPIALPRQLTDIYLSQRLSVDKSKHMLLGYLTQNSETDCEVAKFKVQLRCQYFGTPITHPARSRHCSSHYQPFDLNNFVRVSMSSAQNCVQKWKCPVCKKRAYDLVIDEYLENLMLSKGNLKEIAFGKDAEPIFVEREKQPEQPSEDPEPISQPQPNYPQPNYPQPNYPQPNYPQPNYPQPNYPNQLLNKPKEAIIQLQDQADQEQHPTPTIQLQEKIEAQENSAQQQALQCPQNNQKKSPQIPNKSKRTLEIIALDDFEDQMQEEQPQTNLKRTIEHRLDSHQNDLPQQIRKIPAITEQQVSIRVQKETKQTVLTPTQDSGPAKTTLNIATKLKELLPLQQQLKPKQSESPLHFGQAAQQASVPKRAVQRSAVVVDVDSEDEKKGEKEKQMLEEQRILLEQAKKTLSKDPLTRFDQITFNLICRQLSNLNFK